MLSSILILASTLLVSLSSALPLPQAIAGFPSNTEVGSSGMYTELGASRTTIITPREARPQLLNVAVGEGGMYTELGGHGQGEAVTLTPGQAENVPVGDGGMFTELGGGDRIVVVDS